MPMYGVEAYIGRAIESVLRQTFTAWELIIVNDGTKDRSREIAAGYKKDERICIIDKANGGLTSARLKGLEYAQGNYLVFIDSDDTLQPEFLEVLFDNIVKNDADVCMCSYNIMIGEKSIPQKLYFPDETTIIKKQDIFEQYYLPQVASVKRGTVFLPSFLWLRLFKKEIVTEDLFVSERVVYQEDLVFSARIHKRISRVVVVNRPLYNYYVNMGSLTQKYCVNAWKMMKALTNEIKLSFEGYSYAITEEKIQSSIVIAAHFVLMNAARLDYKRFKIDFENIINDEMVTSVCRNLSFFSVKWAYVVMIIAIRIHCPFIIYRYNKQRVQK